MSLKASTVNGLAIVTMEDGKNVNKVKDIIYDGETNEVKALLIDEKGWFKGAKILMLSDIESIGKDAVIIKNEDCFVNSSDQNDGNISVIVDDNNFLTKNRVLTESGVDLGRVTDLYFEFPSGEVTAIDVSKGFLQNLASGTKKLNLSDITIGKDNLIVKDFNEEEFEIQSQEMGLNKVINDTKSATTSIAAATIAKSQEIAEATKSKFDEVVNSEPVQNTINKAQELTNTAKENISNTYNSAKEEVQSGRAEDKIKESFNTGKEKIQEMGNKVQDKVSNTYNDTKEDFESGKMEHDNKKMLEETKENIEETVSDVNHKINKESDDMGRELESKMDNKMKERAIDKVVTYDVFDNKGNNVAHAGDIVTESTIMKAEKYGALEKLLKNLA